MPDIPDRAPIAADEQRIAALLRAVEAPAPSGLTHRIAARNDARRWWQGAPAFALGLAGAAAGACAALVLLLTSGSVAAPTVVRASLVALERPTAATAPSGLRAAGTDIAFPDWSGRGWPSSGTRSDQLGGRSVTTVFYRSYEAGTIGYTIVAGAPLTWGANGVSRSIGGERYAAISSSGTAIVTWIEHGHTCILASRSASPEALLSLAASQGRAASA